jgi:glycosyltransferase involved in cell wall biosynthesis
VHYEGVTSGTDTGQGVKAYQVANSVKLFERWKGHLQSHQPNAQNVDGAKDRMALRRVLVIDHTTPTPNQDAGSVTVVNFLTLLREMRFQVTFVPEDNFLYQPAYTRPLQRAGIEVLYAPHDTSVEYHLQDCGDRYDLVLIWRPMAVAKHLATVRRYCPRAKVVYHTVDLHYLRMEREAELLNDLQLLQAAEEMKQRELGAIQAVDSAIVHSTHELDVLSAQIPVDNVFVFPLIMNVPGSEVPWKDRSGVAFVGGFQHAPNVDAVQYFASEVMPFLRELAPDMRFYAIGSKPPPELLALASDDVVITGFVEELQPLLDQMRVSVAPLRYGAGIKGKVGNSMAMGLPVVATPIAIEGMGLMPGEHLLVAEGAQALAQAIHQLSNDEVLWSRLQLQGVDYVERLWGGLASYVTLQRLLGGLGLSVGEPPSRLRLYRDSKE